MSFDVMVFDPAGAPDEPSRIGTWLRELDDASTARGAEASTALSVWERDMRTLFRGYEEAPETLPDDGRFAGYTRQGSSIRLACTYSVAADLEAALLATAPQHRVGFWIMSAGPQRIWVPPARPLDTSPVAGFTLTLEGRGDIDDPSEAQVAAAAGWLDIEYGPGFLILERADGDYVQAAGGSAGLTVEWRTDAASPSFRHRVAATSADESGEMIPLQGHGRTHPVLPNERLFARDAGLIFRDFLRGDDPTPRYAWHDITQQLGAKG